MDQATLSDRLNPTHPKYDADLKEKWGKMSKKEKAEYVKQDQALLSSRTEKQVSSYAFHASEEDHCETGREAYQDIIPFLKRVAGLLKKTPAELKIYDPYFCQGTVKMHLAAGGFTNVYNENEDFYEKIRTNTIPDYDVFLTNPAYSSDHIPRLFEYLANVNKPIFLLMPIFVAGKEYFTRAQKKKDFFFLWPRKRYMYWTPKGLRKKTQSHSSALGNRTSPFLSMWYVSLGDYDECIFAALFESNDEKLVFAKNQDELPPFMHPSSANTQNKNASLSTNKNGNDRKRVQHDRKGEQDFGGREDNAERRPPKVHNKRMRFE